MMDWQPVISPIGGFAHGFDPSQFYEFKRQGSDKIDVFRMADQAAYFNVAGLLWRPALIASQKTPSPIAD